ncbi:MAG TPA: xylose isomerase, partial [Chitinophagaceae bacterium]|nr:xylose isomerase [Chitinophagaceae bacterium]
MSNRRKFIQQTILGISGSALLPVIGNANSSSIKSISSTNSPLQIGMAGYSFAKFSLDQSITMMKRIGLTHMSLKEMHLPLNSTDEQISAAMAKYKAAGINIYTVGVLYMKSKEAVDKTFEYAK